MPTCSAYRFCAKPSFSNRSNTQTDLSLRVRTDVVDCQAAAVYDFHRSRLSQCVSIERPSNRFASDEDRQPNHLANQDFLQLYR